MRLSATGIFPASRLAASGVALILVLTTAVCGAPARGPYATQLAAECDALIQAAVRRPFGWAWDNVPPTANSNAPRHVTFERTDTPAAGLLLLLASQALEEPRFQEAAAQVSRGISSAQSGNGKFPEHAIFGTTSASSRDQPEAVLNRSATSGGLALMLLLHQSIQNKTDPATRAMPRALQFLVHQQADDGAWQSPYPSDATLRETQRLIRLDDSDYRDCTFTLLLAANVLGDVPSAAAAARSVNKLLALRLGTATIIPTTEPADAPPVDEEILRRNSNLWSSVYRPNGLLDPKLEQFPIGADMIATRVAMQTLIGAYLVNGDRNAGQALDTAHRALIALQTQDGQWRRIYPMQPTTAPVEVDTGSIFRAPSTQPLRSLGTFDLPRTMENVNQLKLLGRQRYLTMMAQPFSLEQRLAAAVCGLTDDPFALDLPLTAGEVDAYVKTHQADFAILQRPIPQDLPSRLHRLWILLVRTRLEQMQQG